MRVWVEDALGAPVVEAETQVGGMSPGCAARLCTAAGARAFVKATGARLSDGTAELFRREIAVLSALPDVPYRTRLRSSYDDDWVALLLDDIEGRFPDLTDAADAAAVWDTVTVQSAELCPPPSALTDLPSLAETARRMVTTWRDAIVPSPERYLPLWAVSRVPELLDRIVDLPDQLPSESLSHWDLREDNMLLRPDGSVVILDWGWPGCVRAGPTGSPWRCSGAHRRTSTR
ncbi:MAG: phosphotransferase [Geodermatophilaceae bacterium]|nr:phosphotransferase [Geodermatophilaceae bacterium]